MHTEALGTSGSAATSFFHRIWSSDLSRALETTRLVVRELLAPESTEPGQADARIAIDKNLREILGGMCGYCCDACVYVPVKR